MTPGFSCGGKVFPHLGSGKSCRCDKPGVRVKTEPVFRRSKQATRRRGRRGGVGEHAPGRAPGAGMFQGPMGHPEIENQTPFAFAPVFLADEEGRPQLVTIVKATYAITDDGLVLAEEQAPVNVAGEPWG